MQPDSHRTGGEAGEDGGREDRTRFDPLTFVQLPRVGTYAPNPAGTLALVLISTYDHSRQKTTRSAAVVRVPKIEPANDRKGEEAVRLGDIADGWETVDHLPLPLDAAGAITAGHQTILSGLKYSEVSWLDDSTVIFSRPPGAEASIPDLDPSKTDEAAAKLLERRLEDLKEAKEGSFEDKGIELWAKDLSGSKGREYRIGRLPTEVSDLKWHRISDSSGHLAFSASVYAPYDVSALWDVHEKSAAYEMQQEGSSGQTFSSVFVRHWDTWKDQFGKARRTFVVDLHRSLIDSDTGEKTDQWVLDLQSISAPMARVTNAELPVGPFGSASDFDLGNNIFACTIKDPSVNPAWHTRQEIYVVPLAPHNDDAAVPRPVTSGNQGATACPSLSPTAKSAKAFASAGHLVWLEQAEDGYEADRNVVIIMELKSRQKYRVTESWDRSPTSVRWSHNESGLWLTAEDAGHVKLFYLPIELDLLSAACSFATPVAFTSIHSVSGLELLPTCYAEASPNGDPAEQRLLLTQNSFVSPNAPFILCASSNTSRCVSVAGSMHALPSFTGPQIAPLKLSEPESFCFPGDGGLPVHGFLLRPSHSSTNRPKPKSLPLAFLIHGGPQGAWLDSWSWRWNANVFAAAGYMTAVINPTGSTGYGQHFTDKIQQNWGGSPYCDLVAGYEFLLDHYPEIDRDRTVALGASYGGYMVSWLMGHNPGFSAFVCHDGIFSTKNTWFSTEELYFPTHDFGGVPWEVSRNYDRWDPGNHVKRWNKPCLVIHSDLDFRLPLSEGISVFNTLQRLGIPSKLLRFPDEDHWVNKPANSIRWHKEVLKFIGDWSRPSNDPRSGYDVGYSQFP